MRVLMSLAAVAALMLSAPAVARADAPSIAPADSMSAPQATMAADMAPAPISSVAAPTHPQLMLEAIVILAVAVGFLILLGFMYVQQRPAAGDASASDAVTPPTPTPLWLQPGLWVAIATPICALVSMKLGLTLDAAQLVGVLLPVAALIYGLFHHTTSTDVAAIAAHANVTAANVQAQAAQNAGTAAAGLKS